MRFHNFLGLFFILLSLYSIVVRWKKIRNSCAWLQKVAAAAAVLVVKYIKYNGNTEAIYYIGLSNDLNSYFVVQRKKKNERANVCVNIWFICLDIHSTRIWCLLLKSWIFGFTFVIELIRDSMDLLLLVWRSLHWFKKPQYGFFMRNSLFSPILFFPPHHSKLCVCSTDLTVACFAWDLLIWFLNVHFWGHTLPTTWNRCDIKRIDSSSYYVRIGIWCVFDKSIGLILNDFKFFIFSFFIFVKFELHMCNMIW